MDKQNSLIINAHAICLANLLIRRPFNININILVIVAVVGLIFTCFRTDVWPHGQTNLKGTRHTSLGQLTAPPFQL